MQKTARNRLQRASESRGQGGAASKCIIIFGHMKATAARASAAMLSRRTMAPPKAVKCSDCNLAHEQGAINKRKQHVDDGSQPGRQVERARKNDGWEDE
jgi:hypothetical protein